VQHDPPTVIHEAGADMLTGHTSKAVRQMRYPSGRAMKAWKVEGWTAIRVGRRWCKRRAW